MIRFSGAPIAAGPDHETVRSEHEPRPRRSSSAGTTRYSPSAQDGVTAVGHTHGPVTIADRRALPFFMVYTRAVEAIRVRHRRPSSRPHHRVLRTPLPARQQRRNIGQQRRVRYSYDLLATAAESPRKRRENTDPPRRAGVLRRETQYTAVLFTKRCEKAGIEISMGSVGDCFDNAVCETFHATLKKEKIYRQSWPTRAEARTAIFAYIEGFYNPRRRHSTLGYLSPIQFERHHAELTRLALEHSISDNGTVASISPRALDGLRTRRGSTVGVDFVIDGLTSPRTRTCCQPSPLRPRQRPSRDERPPVASPTGSRGTRTLIQTSTTKAKTCRPNRGQSKATKAAPVLACFRLTPTTSVVDRRATSGPASA